MVIFWGLSIGGYITRQFVQSHPDKIYVFGDNLQRKGLGGQARELRGEPNAYGVPTKKSPSMTPTAFFTDTEYLENITAIELAISKIPLDDRDIIVLPIGTGRAQLPTRAPKTYKYLIKALTNLNKFYSRARGSSGAIGVPQ